MESDTRSDELVRTDPTASQDRPKSQPAHPARKRRLLWFLIPLAALSLYLVLLVDAVGSVRNDLLDARSAMEEGRAELLDGDAEDAADSFDEGQALFAAAEGRARGPLLRPAGWLPILGRTIDAVTAIAGSGATAAEGASLLAEAVADLPGGPEGLAPQNGKIPVERIPPLAEAAAEADVLMTSAVERLAASPDTLLLGPVAPARDEAEEQLRELRETIHTVAGLLARLPTFLGSDGPRTYFFGAQNPAELRGTGGLIGAYALLTIDDGRFRFSPFASVNTLPRTPLDELPPPNEDFATNYDQFRGRGRYWSAINVMPDFPSVAQAILTAYEAGMDRSLDGVIVADPFALAALLEATGPVDLPRYGVRIDADTLVAFTTNEAYSIIARPGLRKRVLGDAARVAFERFITSSAGLGDLELLLEAAAGRHIQAYSSDPAMEEALRSTPAGGTLLPPGSAENFVSVVVNSAAGSKVDFYQRRQVRHSVVLGEDGSATATTELVLRNLAPTSGQPPYVIGPFKQVDEAGESIALAHVYCGRDCIPVEARLNGAPIDAGTRVDLGVRYVQHYYSIRSNEEASLEVSWEEPEAWEGNSSGGTYRVTFANQIMVHPSTLSIRIEPPEGMAVLEASDPLRIVDGAAVYEGTPDARLDLEIEFAPPLTTRLWRNLTRFLTTPVIRL